MIGKLAADRERFFEHVFCRLRRVQEHFDHGKIVETGGDPMLVVDLAPKGERLLLESFGIAHPATARRDVGETRKTSGESSLLALGPKHRYDPFRHPRRLVMLAPAPENIDETVCGNRRDLLHPRRAGAFDNPFARI